MKKRHICSLSSFLSCPSIWFHFLSQSALSSRSSSWIGFTGQSKLHDVSIVLSCHKQRHVRASYLHAGRWLFVQDRWFFFLDYPLRLCDLWQWVRILGKKTHKKPWHSLKIDVGCDLEGQSTYSLCCNIFSTPQQIFSVLKDLIKTS